jgi:hypothetical protein
METRRTNRTNRDVFGKTPGWFKAWFAFCAFAAVAFLGVIVWAIVETVTWLTR